MGSPGPLKGRRFKFRPDQISRGRQKDTPSLRDLGLPYNASPPDLGPLKTSNSIIGFPRSPGARP